MRIESIRVENFHGFEEFELEFEPRFNVLVGDNATGKTGLLDALSVAVGSFFLGFDEYPTRHIRRDEVRQEVYVHEELPDLQARYPAVVKAVGKVHSPHDDHRVAWTRELNGPKGRTTHRQAGSMKKVSRALLERVRNGQAVDLPVIAYYGTGRLWLLKKRKQKGHGAAGSRQDGYIDCLDPASNHRLLHAWMRRQTMAAAQRGKPVPQMAAIETAVKRCIGRCERFYYDLLNEELRVELEGGDLLPLELLSDGYRSTLAMVADIAWRASVLNPHHGAEAPEKSRGVILIDEIDLHLHPKWQRRVVDDLKRTFPQIQFVATTHSPFIVQSLENGQVHDLEERGARRRPAVERLSIEDIAEEVMDVEEPQRSRRFRAMKEAAKEYYRALETLESAADEEVEELERRLDRLSAPFSENPAYQALLEMERVAARGRREREGP